jgi:hypothetical protein
MQRRVLINYLPVFAPSKVNKMDKVPSYFFLHQPPGEVIILQLIAAGAAGRRQLPLPD